MFDGTLGTWDTSPIPLDLSKEAEAYHGISYLVPNHTKRATKRKAPVTKTIIPKISAKRFKVKLLNELAIFLISICINQIYHFVSSNFCC